VTRLPLSRRRCITRLFLACLRIATYLLRCALCIFALTCHSPFLLRNYVLQTINRVARPPTLSVILHPLHSDSPLHSNSRVGASLASPPAPALLASLLNPLLAALVPLDSHSSSRMLSALSDSLSSSRLRVHLARLANRTTSSSSSSSQRADSARLVNRISNSHSQLQVLVRLANRTSKIRVSAHLVRTLYPGSPRQS
jgi:hypothetical protein